MVLNLGDLSSIPVSLDRIQQNIINTTEQMFSGRVSLWLSNTAFNSSQVEHFPISELASASECTPIMLDVIKKGRIISRQTSSDNCDLSDLYSIAAPITNSSRVIGVLSVDRKHTPFSRSEKKAFKALVLQTGITLAVAWKLLANERSIELLELVRSVSQQIINVYDIDELSSRVINLILDTFHYYYVAVFTVDPDSDRLQFRHSAVRQDIGSDNNSSISWDISINRGEGIIGRVALLGQEILENDVAISKYYRHFEVLPETKAEFALPFVIGDRTIGVLDVQSDKADAFGEVDVMVLRALADSIALAINNAHLYSDVNRRAGHLATVGDISKAIASILDFDHLLNDIVSLIHIRFSIPRVNLFTVHPGRGKIFYRAGAGQLPNGELLVPFEFSYDINDPSTPVSWSVLNRQSTTVNNFREDSRFTTTPGSSEAILSEHVIPLMFGGEVLGVLDLQSHQVDDFKQDIIFLIEALADYVSVALRNANLYSSEQWRRQVSESLGEVAGLLSADIELEKVLERILEELQKTLPCDVSAIWLLDDFETETGLGQYTSPLRLAAIYPETEDLRQLMQLNELPGSLSPWIVEALDSKKPLIRSTTSPYEPIGAFLNYPPEYSAIAAQLRAGNQTLGLLVLTHRATGRYGSESRSMTATFANYSAVAIKNTKLYEAAHDQAWVATVLLQVTEATQSITSIKELIETVVRIIPRLVGLKSCVLFIRDDATETFSSASQSGLDEIQVKDYESWLISPGEVSAFDQIIEEKIPIIIDHATIPVDIARKRFPSLDFDRNLFGLFPMVAQNNVRGAILINFDTDDNAITPISGLFEEKFTILQGIANQTAVALDNIQLLQSQEEETYISVALLQVAQAIVSLNNLDEILSTIVRITPILVGVKRCVLFICDEEKQEFQLSQHYGVSKLELSELRNIQFSDHFLLQSIRLADAPFFRHLGDDNETPKLWEQYSSDDIFLLHTAADTPEGRSDADRELLKYKGRLLYGIPLSIKGNVLGIMVVEEADNPRGTPTYNIRQRRLEIITGITQQAALAIHNDRLQRELVGRERLEREMQLAREIQTTFLPDIIPDIPGWDLDIHWRPARQVGGDFYDLISFGDGRIGLIMADVADKGMPAALFMTLVRTLIRAAAKDDQSPANILMQANNLLVPDAKQGMFVTVLIAVFTPDDGTLIYANAGHNPGIIHHTQNGSFQDLPPTGMALGVIEGTIISEQCVSINPGDQVIFYTDGITEAFSITDEMFGIDRLKATILTCNQMPANELLRNIEYALSSFINGAPQSDDITVAALIRRIR